ncbi:MAG: arginine repressor [Chloroherpetonaceae bacterium]|nr:arginine repressor [Chloroherpetonaceae bacterium]
MEKQDRQLAIKEVITSEVIANQEELAVALQKKGYEVNQATLSRDLRELGIAKVNTAVGTRYVLHTEGENQRLRMLISYEIESIISNDSLVVVKTLPGRASGVAQILDSIGLPDIMATLAGDNVIFIAPINTRRTKQIEEALRKIVSQARKDAKENLT